MTETSSANVYTIPSGIPFVDALAGGLLAQAGGDPLALSRMTVLLPNRRACRALQEAFLRLGVTNGGAILLPRLQPIGEVDEEDLAVLGASVDALDIPPAISTLRRQMLLARLVQKASLALPRQAANGSTIGEMRFDQALRLAAELARLIDQVETERLDFARIADLVPADFAAHWQITVRFLDILREAWPEILRAEGCIDPAHRRNLLIERQCALWRDRPPQDPVIAAGSTGSIPASADLIALVTLLPQGAVVLPGLDRHADAAAWTAIAEDPAHPQFGLAQLLRRLEVAPDDVRDWPIEIAPGKIAVASPETRRRIVAHALLPADETKRWPRLAKDIDRETAELAWRGVRRIDCHTEQEEAGIIALLLRHAAERAPGFRAALVTPDRGLARRVAAEMGRWQIAIDDSAGQPLNLTAPGAFLVLIAEAAAADWAPGPLLALLKHPMAAGGRSPAQFRAAVRSLERLAS
jgi:ATP-dependent helicase/nuclease subunit B